MSIGFVGGGRITRVFLEGWRRHGELPPEIVVSDPDAAVVERLAAAFPGVTVLRDDNARAARQDVVFAAVHPPVMKAALAPLASQLQRRAVVVSLAPKFTFAALRDLLGGHDRLARVIPNAPSIIGAGFNPTAFGPGLDAEGRDAVATLLAPLGRAPEVPESQLEAYAVIAAMGPTYLWFQLDLLATLGREFGLPAPAAAEAVNQMAIGAARTLAESGLTPAEVMDLIPVRPMADEEAALVAAYRTRLTAIHQKIRPA
ncbi:MAG: NAD(P)-binding domain-containing protein [Vicinamibacteria bacterium]|nr:NAD(P)-binding domain-containing protein [Vicinamibacteria bacterium]